MIDKLLSILTVESMAGKRTFTLVMLALGAGLWYVTSDSTTWIYQHIEEVLAALGIGSVATIRMAIANAIKGVPTP